MLKSKFAVAALAAALATAPVLTACGGQSDAGSSATKETTVETKTEDTASAVADGTTSANDISIPDLAEWGAEGAMDDNSFGVLYAEARSVENMDDIAGTLVLVEPDTGICISFNGPVTEDAASGKSTIRDRETGSEITFTTPDVDPTTGEIKMTIDEHGKATLKMSDDAATVRKDIADVLEVSEKAEKDLAAGETTASDAAGTAADTLAGVENGIETVNESSNK